MTDGNEEVLKLTVENIDINIHEGESQTILNHENIVGHM